MKYANFIFLFTIFIANVISSDSTILNEKTSQNSRKRPSAFHAFPSNKKFRPNPPGLTELNEPLLPTLNAAFNQQAHNCCIFLNERKQLSAENKALKLKIKDLERQIEIFSNCIVKEYDENQKLSSQNNDLYQNIKILQEKLKGLDASLKIKNTSVSKTNQENEPKKKPINAILHNNLESSKNKLDTILNKKNVLKCTIQDSKIIRGTSNFQKPNPRITVPQQP